MTAHSGARPEHARWQGQLVTLTGEDAGETIDRLHVYPMRSAMVPARIQRQNCRHDWHAYYKAFPNQITRRSRLKS
ncbi:MAG: phage minor capsid protein [Ruminococcus sp.]